VAVGSLGRPDQGAHGLYVAGGEPPLDLEVPHAPTLSLDPPIDRV